MDRHVLKSDDLPGLVTQEGAIQDTLEIARDVGKKLLEAKTDRAGLPNLPPAGGDNFDYPLVIGG